MNVKIYHNPRCSKSRQALALLQDQSIQPDVIEYLKKPPSEEELDAILLQLGLEPRQLMRIKEAEYASLQLANPVLSRAQLIKAMHDYPKLIERPIVVVNDKAVLGRPPEVVLTIL